MPVLFKSIQVGKSYSRVYLARYWGYSGYQAIARGVVTPKSSNKIILFVTEEKQPSMEQYHDRLSGDILHWEGPTDHWAEDRIVQGCDEIHLFHRRRHHSDFVYFGIVSVVHATLFSDRPSRFSLRLNTYQASL